MSTEALMPVLSLCLFLAAVGCGGDDESLPPGDGAPADAASRDAPALGDAPTGDAPAADGSPGECTATMTSDLPGVRIVFPDQPCRFTLAEAAAGIDIAYDVIIDAALMNVRTRPQDAGGCGTPGDSGLILFEDLGGGGERYCLCDVGLCPGSEPIVDLVAGTWRSTFHWEGRNWMGPSDTSEPMGEPFPAGDYTLRASAVGDYMGSAYTVDGTFPVRLSP